MSQWGGTTFDSNTSMRYVLTLGTTQTSAVDTPQVSTSKGIAQYFDLTNANWVNNQVTIGITLPELISTYGNVTCFFYELTTQEAMMPTMYVPSLSLNYNNSSSAYSNQQGGHTTVSLDASEGFCKPFTKTLRHQSSGSYKFWICIYSTSTTVSGTWYWGGVVFDPSYTVPTYVKYNGGIGMITVADSYSNLSYRTSTISIYQSPSNPHILIDHDFSLGQHTYSGSVASLSIGKGVWTCEITYSFSIGQNFVPYVTTKTVYIDDPAELTVKYNNTTISSGDSIAATANTGYVLNLSGSHDYVSESFYVNYYTSIDSTTQMIGLGDFNAIVGTTDITYYFTLIGMSTGWQSSLYEVNFTLSTASIGTITQDLSALGKVSVPITISGSISGGLYVTVTLNSNSIVNHVALTTITSSTTYNFTYGNLQNSSILDLNQSDNTLTFDFSIEEGNRVLATGTKSLSYEKPTLNLYNQTNDSNITGSNNLFCNKVRFCISNYDDSGLTIGTWGYTATVADTYTSTSASLPAASGSHYHVDCSFANSLGSNVTKATSLVLTNSTAKFRYSFSSSITSRKQPNFSSNLACSPASVNYFTTDTTTNITPTFPTLESSMCIPNTSTYYYEINGVSKAQGQISDASKVVTWNSLKSGYDGTKTGSDSNLFKIKFTNVFGEIYRAPVSFTVNYNAGVQSFTISRPSGASEYIENGTSITINYSMNRTTQETLTLNFYLNNDATNIATVQLDTTTNSGNIVYTPTNLSGSTVTIYAKLTHTVNIATQTSNSLTYNVITIANPEITLNSVTLNKNDDHDIISYSYTVSSWGKTGTPSSVAIKLKSSGLSDLTLTAPSASATLPVTITGTVNADSWHISSQLQVKLGITVTIDGTTLTDDSNYLSLTVSTPTVAYRHNRIGINTSNPLSSSVVDIHTLDTKPNITLVSSSGVITINPTNGTIDFEFLS